VSITILATFSRNSSVYFRYSFAISPAPPTGDPAVRVAGVMMVSSGDARRSSPGVTCGRRGRRGHALELCRVPSFARRMGNLVLRSCARCS